MNRKTRITEYLENLERLGPGISVLHRETRPAKRAVTGTTDPPLPVLVENGLEQLGISRLYSHQAEAVRLVRKGENIVVVTPTASGKTLTFFLPILESLLSDQDGCALLLYPLKALEQDQLRKIGEWQEFLNPSFKLRAEIFDGDTPSNRRKKIKQDPPHLLLSNPDMLHQGLLAYHQSWEKFLRKLRFVVIDELHTYRGVFGSQILQVLRRLSRLVSYYEASPQFICLSATIANPRELASTLTGRDFALIDVNGAPAGRSHWLFIRPDTSSTTAAVKLLSASLDAGLNTIVFTKSRVSTEIIHRTLTDMRPDLAKVVSSYRAGFLSEQRRSIESRLSKGELKGVISTSALELGIDIGGLDVCILVGYPGSVMSAWQRSGRVGRKGNDSITVMIGGYDALDQYFMMNPQAFFSRPVEAALVSGNNEEILRAHLPAAASEIPLMKGDPFIDVEHYKPVLDELEREGQLVRSSSGNQWFPSASRPHAAVSLRNVGGTFEIISSESGKGIGDISGGSVMRECHEGAVYLHCGEQYLVKRLDLENRQVLVEPHCSSLYTMIRSDKQTEILDDRLQRRYGSSIVHLGKVKVTETIHSYERRRLYTQELLSVEPLDLPPQSFVTDSIWLEIPKRIADSCGQEELHFMGGIHAVEHATISLVPLFALCDRNDIGGISFTRHAQLPAAAVFVYDGHPGGAGISEHVYSIVDDLLDRTENLLRSCPCQDGCPSCIQSPKCGSGNKPLDKQAAMRVLELLRIGEGETLHVARDEQTSRVVRVPIHDDVVWMPLDLPSDRRVVVFDLETQRSAEEVGGWTSVRQMRLAVAAVWDSADQSVSTYEESDIEGLLDHLKRADLVVGFNVIAFDYEVLRGYTFENLSRLPTLDLLVEVEKRLGKRLKLDSLSRSTLNCPKTADGLQSLVWFREGRLDLVREYCVKDVEITRDLLMFALNHGYLLYERKDAGKVRLPLPLYPLSYMKAVMVK